MLRRDHLYRGPHAVHVKKRHKLGKHRTIIHSAFAIVNDVICDHRVQLVSLGRIFTVRKKSTKVHVSVCGPYLRLVVSDLVRLQTIRIYLHTPEHGPTLAETIAQISSREKFAEIICANGHA